MWSASPSLCHVHLCAEEGLRNAWPLRSLCVFLSTPLNPSRPRGSGGYAVALGEGGGWGRLEECALPCVAPGDGRNAEGSPAAYANEETERGEFGLGTLSDGNRESLV